MDQENFFKRKKVAAGFSVFALVSGFTFLNKGITGNVILNGKPVFDIVPFIGLLLVFFSAIMALYAIKKK